MENYILAQENHEEDDQDFIHPLFFKKISTMDRRKALTSFGSILALALLASCVAQKTSSSGPSSSGDDGTPRTGCGTIPSETEGPYPLNSAVGSSTAQASSIYRSNIIGNDITDSNGVPLTLVLNIVNTNMSCQAISNAAVYIWHCDQSGEYSGYSSSQNGYHSGKTFCRGIQVSGSDGKVTFQTIYPGWYVGRITHIHVAIYLNNNLSSRSKVTQFGFPQDITKAIYNYSPYSAHGQNSSVASFSQDNVFSDGVTWQIASVVGNVDDGYTATINIGISG
jgi:protocatechuate 3,4-dioxygenase beta subunit